MINFESSDVEGSDRRPRHDNDDHDCRSRSSWGRAAPNRFDDWFDPIEAGLRDRVRGLIETMLESELDEVLARPRYGRHPFARDGEVVAVEAPPVTIVMMPADNPGPQVQITTATGTGSRSWCRPSSGAIQLLPCVENGIDLDLLAVIRPA